jgi:phosphomannomutase
MVKRKVAASVPSGEALVEAMTSAFPGGVPDLTDGAKICWPDRWVHVRMSGTEPIVRLIAEARREADADALVRRAAEIVLRLSEGTRSCAAS